MDTKHQPATPLPWSRTDGHYHHVRTEDIDYFIHAANAYPRLVEALKMRALATKFKDREAAAHAADALLRELGEIAPLP